jgi:hypothetical protein
MFHSSTEFILDYWRERKGTGLAPARSAVSPTAFAHLLPQVFIATNAGQGRFPLCLAGERLAESHGERVRGKDVCGLWAAEDRRELQSVLNASLRRGDPVVFTAEAMAGTAAAFDVEVLFAPLLGPELAPDRFLGLYQPLSNPGAAKQGQTLRLSTLTIADLCENRPLRPRPPLRLAVLHGQLVA